MNSTKVLKAEMHIRAQANAIYQAADHNDGQTIEQANELVDLADELETLTTFKSIPDFSKALDNLVNQSSEQKLEQLYNQDFVITFNGMTTKIPFDAVSYNAIQTAIKTILEEQ